MKSILLLGDAHLRDGDPELESFLQFLRSIPDPPDTLIIVGDLFDLWIGSPAFLSDCHRRVIEQLEALQERGTQSIYVEGNRDYRLKSLYKSGPFKQVCEDGLDLTYGGRTLHIVHGDRINRSDRPYRLWRRIAKGPWLLGALEWLPAKAGRSVAMRLERRIARTNRRHRIAFPETECRRFALEQRGRGADTLVLGHFHKEMRLTFDDGAKKIEVYVLGSWREDRRFLRIREDGRAQFEGIPVPGVAS
jgi:UDP-2,3-diacylglucosamine hydrolase